MNTDWTVSKARAVLAQMTKVAEDLVDQAQAMPAAPEAAGTAGPQEVVDALAQVVQDITSISEAIPAEPSAQEPGLEEPSAPVAEPIPEEEEPKLAKQVRELTAQLEKIELEKVAKTFAELHEEPKVQQAKYDEVLSSNESPKYWIAKIEAIEQYKQNEGVQSTYRPAKQMTSWIKPSSKFAKQASNEIVNL